MLSPYRVLDLTDVRGQIAGMILGDLGADVIRIEPPRGAQARRVGPFLDRGPEAERSLSFLAYNRNKRSATLDLDAAADRERFATLIRGADFLLDSGPDGVLAEAGLKPSDLAEWNPELVHVQITGFGSDGPAATRPVSDLTVAAMGGPVSIQGDPDRPPVRMSVPQTWRHAGAEAAVAALVGHARARTTGRGVFVDVSAQSAMTWTMLNAMAVHAILGRDFDRQGSNLQLGTIVSPLVHPCRDGYVVVLAVGANLQKLLPCLIEDGIVDESWIDKEDWTTWATRLARKEPLVVSAEELVDVIRRFLAPQDKQALLDRGLAHDATIAPVNTLDDLLAFRQLEARGYFRETSLPDGSTVRAPGAFARPSAHPLRADREAPRPGEHTVEVLRECDEGGRRRESFLPIETPSELPFEGLRVADFSWVGVGPISGRYLADHGADVIRIESQRRADDLRTAGPHKDGRPGWNRSHFYGEFNASKRSLALDLKHERHAEVVDRLLGWADVVLESFTPGSAARLGLGYEHAASLNPSVVMVSTCLMGQTGPYAGIAGYGYHAGAIAGFYDVTGWPDRGPAGPWQAYTDTIAPRFLTATLLAALDHRRRTGEGQHIDLGQMEASLQFLAPELMARQATGENATRTGNRTTHAAPQGTYPCRGEDQWIAIAVETDAQWNALVELVGHTPWRSDDRLRTPRGRVAEHDAIDEVLSEWTMARDPADAMDRLCAAGIPAGVVQRSSDLLTDPQLAHRGFHRVYEHEEMGAVPYSGHQFRVSGYPSGPRGPAPCLGAHSFEVLTDVLGFDAERAAELLGSGAIQ